jgi:hypothetical protein
MDGQFDRLEELIYVESHLSGTSSKFYGEITQQMLKNVRRGGRGGVEEEEEREEEGEEEGEEEEDGEKEEAEMGRVCGRSLRLSWL